MCLEDLKLGRGRFVGKSTRLTGNADNVLPPNAARVAILVTWNSLTTFDSVGSPINADGINVSAGATAASQIFMSFGNGNGAVVLRIEDLGQLVTGAFSVSIANSTGQASICLTEILTEVQAAPAMRDYKP